MATVRRHPVPMEFYDPARPLNDLGTCQLAHFIHAEQRLPPEHRVNLAAPSGEDGLAATRYIAAVTKALLERKRPQLVRGGKPKVKSAGAKGGEIGAIAATSGDKATRKSAAKGAKAVQKKRSTRP